MTTVRQLIQSTLRLLTVVGEGQTATAQQISDGHEILLQMLDLWSVEGDLVYSETKESFALTAGKPSYTIGSGGELDTSRPVEITNAYVAYGGLDHGLEIDDRSGYAQISDKDEQGIPDFVYHDGDYPLGNLYLWPVPNQAMTLHLISEKPLSELGLNDTINLPPGYEKAIRYNLAVDWAPEFEMEASNTIKQVASDSKYIIQDANRQNENNEMTVDEGLLMNISYGDVNNGFN